MKFLILLFLITGCGRYIDDWVDKKVDKRIEKQIPPEEIDSILSPFIEEFKQEAKKYSAPLPYISKLTRAVFTEVNKPTENGSVVGLCRRFKNHKDEVIYTEVYIDNSFQKRLDSCIMKMLMFHELGHCVLGKPHISKARRIMSPQLAGEKHCKNNWTQLVNLLFQKEN